MIWLGIIILVLYFVYEVINWIRLPSKSQTITERETDYSHNENKEPLVSFLVPVWNGAHDITKFIESYQRLNWKNKELIMCVGGPDGSFEKARRYAQSGIVILEQKPGMGKQEALRVSYAHVNGDVIFLADIDCRLTDKNVSALVNALLSSDSGAVTGSICPPTDQQKNPFVLAQWAVLRVGDIVSTDLVGGLRGNNAAVKREAVEQTRCFEKKIFSGTDYTMAKEFLKHGYSIKYVKNCEMASVFPDTVQVYIRKQARWIRNVLVLGAKYKSWGEVASICVTVLIPFFYSLLFALGFFVPLLWELLLIIFLHSVINRLRYARISEIRVNVKGILLSIFGDLGAALTMSYQVITKHYTW